MESSNLFNQLGSEASSCPSSKGKKFPLRPSSHLPRECNTLCSFSCTTCFPPLTNGPGRNLVLSGTTFLGPSPVSVLEGTSTERQNGTIHPSRSFAAAVKEPLRAIIVPEVQKKTSSTHILGRCRRLQRYSLEKPDETSKSILQSPEDTFSSSELDRVTTESSFMTQLSLKPSPESLSWRSRILQYKAIKPPSPLRTIQATRDTSVAVHSPTFPMPLLSPLLTPNMPINNFYQEPHYTMVTNSRSNSHYESCSVDRNIASQYYDEDSESVDESSWNSQNNKY